MGQLGPFPVSVKVWATICDPTKRKKKEDKIYKGKDKNKKKGKIILIIYVKIHIKLYIYIKVYEKVYVWFLLT